MYIKSQCAYLKEGVNPEELEKYGFRRIKENGNYVRDVDIFNWVTKYNDTNRFVFKHPRTTNYKKVKRYIKDLIDVGLVVKKPCWEWLSIFGRYQNYSQKKIDKIKKRLNELQKVSLCPKCVIYFYWW